MNIERIEAASTFREFNEIARELKCNKRFAALVRENGEPEFTTKGIYSKYAVTYYTWIDNGANAVLRVFFSKYRDFLVNALEALNQGQEPQGIPDYEEPLNQEQEEILKQIETPILQAPIMQQESRQDAVKGNMTFEIPIMGMIKEAARQLVPELTRDIKKQITDAAKELLPNVIKIAGKLDVEVQGRQHNDFKKALTLLNIHQQLMLVGPTGSGKTHLSAQIAKGLNLSFGHLSCTAGMSEAHITGRMVADGSFITTQFIEAYENGGVFLFDEVDAADPNVLLLINSAISNGVLSVPNRKEASSSKRHKDFYCVCAANTFGKGSFEYSGREILDEAFLDRFVGATVKVDYDTALELELTKNSVLTTRFQEMRSKVDRTISTRTIISAYKMSEAFSSEEIVEMITLSWTKEERQKAGI